jgi:leucyl aminopeptidase
MLVNNRFVKFKFEKQNENLKLDENNIINVLFYSEKSELLSYGLSNHVNLAKFLKKMVQNNSANTCMVSSEKGMFLLIKRKNHNNELTHKYLEDLGGSIFHKTKSIGCSEVRIFENNQDLNKQIALGILLGSYKFNNYKKNKSKEVINIKYVSFICDEPKKHSQTQINETYFILITSLDLFFL